MFIKNIKLKNFRNYLKLDLNIDKGINIFIGQNAQGKTNILESIYVASYSKTYRTSKEIEMINFEKNDLYIEVDFEKDDHEEEIKIYVDRDKNKNIMINDIKIKKMSELIGYLKVVTFKPEDLQLVKEGPAERRKYLDMLISLMSKEYIYDLQRYNKVLLQKNNYLKNGYVLDEELEIWNTQLIQYGKNIILERKEMINKINTYIEGIHSNLSDEKEKLEIIYEPNTEIDEYEDKMNESISEDKRLKSTQVGPHKDDFTFMINGIDAKKYGSQGQQRTAILSLKFAEIELAINESNEMPILLLDDVLSELDENRQSKMIGYIKKLQTIITCTDINERFLSEVGVNSIFKINEGTTEKM